MAQIVLTNAKVIINSVDLSDHARSVKVSYKADQQDNTVMGNTTHSKLAGLLDWQMDIEFGQDWAANKVDATLFPLVGAAPFTVEVRPVNTSRGATNPAYTGSATLSAYAPLGQKVGDLAVAPATFMAAGTLSRATS